MELQTVWVPRGGVGKINLVCANMLLVIRGWTTSWSLFVLGLNREPDAKEIEMNSQNFQWIVGRGLMRLIVLGLAALSVVGCTEDDPLAVQGQSMPGSVPAVVEGAYLENGFAKAANNSVEIISQDGSLQPGEIVTVDALGQSLAFYPYVTTEMAENAVDPMNVIFVGEVDPVQIRSALLALDGDRTAFGFPAVYPFDQKWTDAMGGSVGATWVEGEGWVGSVIQLTVGNYETLRFHLRLYRTGVQGWTLGSAEFEVMIPGTADHQVLNWELAEQLVVADLMRSGLLAAVAPVQSTGLINQAGGFGEIPAEIYNMLPAELTELVGVVAPVQEPVPIPTDGQGTILHLVGAAPLVSGEFTNSITIEYDQFVPRPYCSSGPYDMLYVTGPVTFDLWVNVDDNGDYRYRSSYGGTLNALPIDVITGQPIGEMFPADVGDRQHGFMSRRGAYLSSRIRRLTTELGGAQILFENLSLHESGPKRYRQFTRCLDAENLQGF